MNLNSHITKGGVSHQPNTPHDHQLVGAINDLLWGDLIILEFSGGEVQFGLSLLVLILIPAGLYFTFKTKFLPFRLFPEMIRVTLEKDEAKKDETLYPVFRH